MMLKKLFFSLTFLFTLNSYSQNKYIYNSRLDTKDIILNDVGDEILLRKNLSVITIEKLKSKSMFNHNKFNFKVDETGKITFIKGNKGFQKINIPEEFIGIHFPPYEDDEVINQLNNLFSEYRLVHFINLVKQSDCKKLKNVLFFGEIKFYKN